MTQASDQHPSGGPAVIGGRRESSRLGGRHSTRFALAALACLIVLAVGAAAAPWERAVDRAIAPYRFSYVTWHLRQYAELLWPVRVPETARSDPAGYVIDYYAQLARVRALVETEQGVAPQEQEALEAARPVAERILAAQVREAYREQGVYGPADRFLRLPITFPPLWFALEPPPHLLVVSPRAEIASLRQDLLVQSMDLATMEAIEREVQALDLSALVTEIGGLGATYPAVVSEDSSLRYTIDTVAEEWLHQYLTFTPLGWNYVLHLLGIREDYAIAQINESLAGVVTDEIGGAVWERYYAPRVPAPGPSATDGDAFDYRAFMRETRVEAERLLARGAVEEAEAWMEARRRIVVAEGYRIRKLNQAYFAFHGTYADAPGSVTPVGDQLRALRAASGSLSDYMNTIVRVRSQQDFLDLLEQRGVGTAQLAPAPAP